MTNEEAKQQAIKNAYGKDWVNLEKYHIKDGWFEIYDLVTESDFMELNENDFDIIGEESKCRLKQLQGIENNNGWIRIESEKDLPKEPCKIWVRSLEFEEIVIIKFTNSFFTPIHKTCTHWMPIITPKPPIF